MWHFLSAKSNSRSVYHRFYTDFFTKNVTGTVKLDRYSVIANCWCHKKFKKCQTWISDIDIKLLHKHFGNTIETWKKSFQSSLPILKRLAKANILITQPNQTLLRTWSWEILHLKQHSGIQETNYYGCLTWQFFSSQCFKLRGYFFVKTCVLASQNSGSLQTATPEMEFFSCFINCHLLSPFPACFCLCFCHRKYIKRKIFGLPSFKHTPLVKKHKNQVENHLDWGGAWLCSNKMATFWTLNKETFQFPFQNQN